VWKVHRSAAGVITWLEEKTEYVYHYYTLQFPELGALRHAA